MSILFVDIPLSVELLVKELKNVTNWREFGVALGIPVSKLDCIKLDNSDVEDKKIQMFQFWLQYKLDASWKTVIQALEQNSYLVLAATLSKRYLLSDSSNTSDEQQGMSLRLADARQERLTALLTISYRTVQKLYIVSWQKCEGMFAVNINSKWQK